MANNCVADTLQALAECFIAEAKVNGQIVVDAGYLSDGIRATLQRDDLVVVVNASAIPPNPQQSLTICGTTPMKEDDAFLDVLGAPICLTFTLYGTAPNQQIVLQARTTLGNAWSFGQSFPEIVGQAADLLTWNGAYLYISSVPVAQSMDVSVCSDTSNPPGTAIVPGVSFWGAADLAGPFEAIVSLITGTQPPALDLYGPIARPPGGPGPTIDLSLVNSFNFAIPGNIITISDATAGLQVLYVATDPEEPTELTPVTVPYAQATVTVAGYSLLITADLWESSSFLTFVIEAADPASTGMSLQDTSSLVGSGGVGGLLATVASQPVVQGLLNAIEFKKFWGTVLLSPTPSLSNVALLVGTPGYDFDPSKPPPPTPPAVAWPPFTDVSIAFNFFGSVVAPVTKPVALAQLEATAWVTASNGPDYIFTIDVSLPDFIISGSFLGTIDINLARLVSDLFGNGLTLPNNLADFQLSDITLTANIPAKNYAFGVVINGELFGANILQLIDTRVTLTVDASGETTAVTGTVNGIISLGGIEFAVTATISNAKNVDTVLQIHLVNETVGSLLGKLFQLVDPSLDVKLPTPWDKLLDINLDALVLQINVSKGSVGISYDARIDLGFLTIDTLSLTYQNDPVQSGVMIAIAGTFLGMSFGTNGNAPLAWDAVNGSPPAVPEGSLLDMRYLGIGQHVTVQGLEDQQTMAAIITAMMNAMKTGQPDFSGGQLVFSDSSGWLIGTDFTLASTVRLSIIFNDPKVYGLLLQLNGAKAGSFAGLSFEILYRKISDSIGLYHVDFTLPDEFRHLEFGEVSITLPSVIVDIYTNGNFLIDLGFPHNMDFSRSFSVQVFPFVGYAGIYFGLLSGATSNRVPQITNGSWNPVIVFGLGVSLGVGKTIDEGVFSAGISVTVQGVLEGVIGWFNPNSPSVPSDRYYWIQGTVRIVGQLYGSVDFGIIKASVSVTAYAGVTLVIEAYQPIYINLTAGVSVTASVKVVFFTIHFSFSMTVSASWTIGSKGTPPWQLASGGGQQGRTALFRSTMHPTGRFLAARATVERLAALRAGLSEAPLVWLPAPQFNTPATLLNVVVGPLFTVADGAPQCVPLLFLENAIDPSALTPAEVRQVADRQAAANQPFNQLAQALLHWAIVAWQRTQQNTTGFVDLGALQYIQEQLTAPDAQDAAFPYSSISEFLAANFTLQLSPRPTTDVVAASATVFPIIPALSIAASGTTVYFDARSQTQVGPDYADKLAAYFAALMAEYTQGVAASGSNGGTAAVRAAGDSTESLATAVFRNYVLMIARAGVRAALDLLTAFPFDPGSMSLAQICAHFPREGDQEVTAESIVATNQSTAAILTTQSVSLSGVVYQARSGNTLATLTQAFGLTGPQLLANAIDNMSTTNAARPGLLQTGATLTVNSTKAPAASPLVYTSQPGDTFALIASLLLVRNAGPAIYPRIVGLPELVQATIQKNLPQLQGVDPNAPLLPGVTSLQVPAGNPPAVVTYPVRMGDTLTSVAAYFINIQQQAVPTATFVQALTAAYPSVNPNDVPPGTLLTLPEIDHAVQPGDTVVSIAAALLVDATTPAGVTTLYNASNLAGFPLQPLAAVPVPPFSYSVSTSDTLAGIASKFNLTLDALAEALLQQGSLFAQPITVPNVPQVAIDELLAALVTQGNMNTVASTVSRFLLHGMQVPLPSDPITAQQLEQDPSLAAHVQTAPLYELLGLQIATPTAPPTLTFANAGGMSWISFGQSEYPVQQGDTLAGILNSFVPSAQQATFTTWLGNLNPSVNLQQLAPPTVLTFPTAAPLSSPYTVQTPGGETLDAISDALAPARPATLRTQIEQLNPGIDTTNPLPVGTAVTLPPSFPTQELELVLTSDELSLSSSLAGVTLDDQVSLYRLPLYNNTPYRYTTQKHLVWQAAAAPACLSGAPAGATGGPSIWLFPDSLIEALAAMQDPNLRYGLFTGVQETAVQPMTITPVQTYAWATLINVEVQRIPGAAGEAGAANACLLVGADAVGQDLLYALLPQTSDATTAVYLLYQPAASSQNAGGYASDALNASGTFILQTNLSQLSNSPSANVAFAELRAARLGDGTTHAASLAQPQEFLQLLWECGVVRSGGYYLNYVNASGGSGLPDAVFSGSGPATLALLVVLNGTAAATPTQTPVPSFVNCAVVADGIDPGTTNVFVQPIVAPVPATGNDLTDVANAYNSAYDVQPAMQAADVATASQDVRGLLIPGVSLALPAPHQPWPVAEGDSFASIAQASGVSVEQIAQLNASATILQPGALVQFAAGQLDQVAAVQPGNSGFQMLRPSPDTNGTGPISGQQYAEQIFQLLEFQLAQNGFFNPSGQGLPAGPTDPNPQGGDTLLSTPLDSTTSWNYQQVFSLTRFAANVSDVAPATARINLALPAKVGGPYAGIAQGSQVQLGLGFRDVFGNSLASNPPLSLSPIPVGYIDDLIGLGQWPGVSAWYVFGQSGARNGGGPQIAITLAFQPGRFTPYGGDDPTGSIQAAGSAAAKLGQVFCQLRQPDALLRYRTTLDASSMNDNGRQAGDPYLLDKGAVVPFVAQAELFTAAMGALQPYSYAPTESDTLQSVAQAFGVSPGAILTANQSAPQNALFAAALTVPIFYGVRPQDSLAGIVAVAAGMGYTITAQQVAENNQAQPLATGTVLTLPTPGSYTTTGKEKLSDVVSQFSCSIGGIVNAPQNDKAEVLATGFIFSATSQSGQPLNYPVAEGDTFTSVAQQFDTQFNFTITPTALATLNQDTPGMFAPTVTLTIPDVVVQEGQSFASLGQRVDDLANANTGVAGIFPQGEALLLATTTYDGQQTLADIATQFGCSLELLAAANPGAGFAADTSFTIPGRVASPQPASFPYRAAGTETVAGLATSFGCQPLDLFALSQDVPDLFQPLVSISVGKGTVQTASDSTFAGLLAALQAQDSTVTAVALAAAVQGRAIVQQGALIVTPPLVAGSNQTLQALATLLNAGVADVAQANAGLQGFVQAGAPLSYASGSVTWNATSGANDTLTTLLAACNAYLAAHGVATPIALAQLAQANAMVDLVSATTPVLPLPPNPVTIAQAVRTNLPGTMFPLVVQLEIDRLYDPTPGQPNLVDPDFFGVTSVYRSVTDLSPQGFDAGSDSNASLRPFALQFQNAFGSGLKLATGQGISEVEGSAQQTLWVVDFQPAGGGRTSINFAIEAGSPTFYAVPPISNTLWGDTVQVPGYTSGQGLTADQPKTFQSVDLDVWGATLLEAVDLFLSPDYAVPAYETDATNFNAVLTAKGSLAQAIAGLLTNVLQGDDQGQLSAAVDTLQQNLLVQLAQAYTIDTVVQYPVNVSSTPYTEAATAARLSGKPATTTYQTGATDTLSTLATAFNVSVPYAAQVIAAYPDILAVGQSVAYGTSKPPYQIQAGGSTPVTLATIADYFGVQPSVLATGMTLQDSSLGLFAANTTIDVSGLSHTTANGDSFASIAAFFDTSLEAIGLANEAVAGLLPAGTYTINNTTVTLHGTETLQQIAADANTTPDQVPVDLPFTALQANVTVYALQSAQAFSLSTAKVELATPNSQTSPTLTFLFSARDAAASRSETLNLSYAVNALECPVAPPDASGYQASNWLSFVLPFVNATQASGAIGQVEVPIPLRAYPNLPVMQSQSGQFTTNPPQTPSELTAWTYDFTYSHESAAQDDTALTVVFNQAPVLRFRATGQYTLPQALARFISVWPLMKPDLALLPQTQPGSNPNVVKAIPAFATVVGDVATAWLAWQELQRNALGASAYTGLVYQYAMSKLSNNDGTLQDVILALTAAPAQDPNGTQLGWPTIEIQVQGNWVTLDGTANPIVQGRPPTCTYTYPNTAPPVQTLDVVQWQLSYALNLTAYQNAWAGVAITRNAQLLSGSSTPTNPLFVYTTPTVGFADKLVPYLVADTPIAFGSGTTPALQGPLETLFTQVVGSGSPNVAVSARYGYQLQPGSGGPGTGMVPLLPIVLYLPAPATGLANKLFGAIDWWFGTYQPATQGGSYSLTLSVYSSVDPSDPQPLMKANSLTYTLTG